MNRDFRPLFDVVCLHDYFGGQACVPLQMRPTPACKRLLERYRLRWSKLPGGIAIEYPSVDPLVPLSAFSETAAFDFVLTNSDPALLSYTDIDRTTAGTPMDGGYYFDNRDSDDGGLLHPAGAPFALGKLALAPPSPAAGMTVHERLQGRQVWPAPGAAPAPAARAARDLRHLPEARYDVHQGGAMAGAFYQGRTLAPGAWGVVAIYGGGRAQAVPGQRAFPIGIDGTPRPRHYRIELGARRCTWRYHVIATSRRTAPAGEIVAVDERPGRTAGAPAGVFRQLPQADPIGGRPATVFESQQALPLLAVPDNRLRYCFRPHGPDSNDLALPYAGPALLAADPLAPQGLRADMYVYV